MVTAANLFKLDSPDSDSGEERNESKVAVQSQGSVSEPNSTKKKKKKKEMKKASVEKPDSESDDGGSGKKSKKKKHKEKVSEERGSHDKALVNTDDDAKRDKAKRKRVDDDTDLRDTEHKPKKTKKKSSVGSDGTGDAKSENQEAEKKDLNKSTKDPEKKRKKKEETEDTEVVVNNKDSIEDADKKSKKKKHSEDSEADSVKDGKEKRKKKQKGSESDATRENPEAEETNPEKSEDKGNDFNSPEIAKKKKKKQIEVPEAEEKNNDGKAKSKKKLKGSKSDANQIQSENQEADLNKSTKDPKKKTKKKQSENTEDPPEIAKKKSKKKKQSEDPEPEDNNNDGKKKSKKKQKGSKSDEVVTTPSSKSAKKVKFSDQVEVFPAESQETDEEEEEEDEQVEVVRGKRFTKEEDELIKKAVLEYVENHALGEEGVNMVMDCQSHKKIRGCWKEIAAALPWRPRAGVYNRAHTIFEAGSKGVWTKEEFELVVEYQKKHGNDWRTLADAMGKHRKHVKDAWRRIRLASKKKGHWSIAEYQSLFDLVNKDLRMKAFQDKRSKHGMLRDNIPWMAISDQLGTRDHTICCLKWYDQLTSPMVAKGLWANVDDYRLLDELTNLDAACIDDVDWDNLLDNRDGDACRRRWDQMVNHMGFPRIKTFAEQVEILSQRYCPDLAEDREDFDNRPFDPEDD